MEKYHLIITSLAQSDIAECVRFVLRISKDAAITLANDIYHELNSLGGHRTGILGCSTAEMKMSFGC